MDGNDRMHRSRDFHGLWFIESFTGYVQQAVISGPDAFKGIITVTASGDSGGNNRGPRFDPAPMWRHHGKPARSATHLDEKITPLDGMTLQFGKICVLVHEILVPGLRGIKIIFRLVEQ
jgi:hypothetical protein